MVCISWPVRKDIHKRFYKNEIITTGSSKLHVPAFKVRVVHESCLLWGISTIFSGTDYELR